MKKTIIALILISLALCLTACPGGGIGYYTGEHQEEFTSFDELLRFTNDFCESYDGCKRFVYFNMDDEDKATERYYKVSMVAKKYDTIFRKDIVPEYFYGFDYEFCFVLEDDEGVEHQIYLKQLFDFDYEIDRNNISFEFLKTEKFDPSSSDPSEYYFDKHDYSQENGSFVRKYEYINFFSLYCGEELAFDVCISSTLKPSQEKLDELCGMLMEHLVIYNFGE